MATERSHLNGGDASRTNIGYPTSRRKRRNEPMAKARGSARWERLGLGRTTLSVSRERGDPHARSSPGTKMFMTLNTPFPSDVLLASSVRLDTCTSTASGLLGGCIMLRQPCSYITRWGRQHDARCRQDTGSGRYGTKPSFTEGGPDTNYVLGKWLRDTSGRAGTL